MKSIWLTIVSLFTMWMIAREIERFVAEKRTNLEIDIEEANRELENAPPGAWKVRVQKLNHISHVACQYRDDEVVDFDDVLSVIAYRKSLKYRMKFRNAYVRGLV